VCGRKPAQLSANEGEAALKYIRVVQWLTKGDSIGFEMLGEDQNIHHFDISAECAGVLLAALAAEFEKLQDQAQQFIRPIGMQTGRTERGEPMLLMTLKGGTELPLVFRSESLGPLISELEKLMKSGQQEPEIRWR
jgi:hypothetical protein